MLAQYMLMAIMELDQLKKQRRHARFVTCITMLVLAFIGLIILKIHDGAYWIYMQIMSGAYAAMSIWLYWYLNRKSTHPSPTSIWHQLLHWFGLGVIVYLLNIYVRTGLLTVPQAGLLCLTALAFSVYLVGVYTDASFMFIGLTLAIFAGGIALIAPYLYALMIPVIIVVGVVIYLIMIKDKKREAPKHNNRDE